MKVGEVAYQYPVNNMLSEEDIRDKRWAIYQTIIALQYGHDLGLINSVLVQTIFDLYDRIFFDGCLRTKIEEQGSTISFDVSNRMTSSAGKLIRKGTIRKGNIRNYTLRMSGEIYPKRFTNPTENILEVNGIYCSTRLGCFLTVIEHEIIHLLMSIYPSITGTKGNGPYSSHGDCFKHLSAAIFNHSKIYHCLLPGFHGNGDVQIRHVQSKKGDYRMGDRIQFKGKKDQILNGTIIKLNPKRAQVKIEDGIWHVYYNTMTKL